MMTCRWRTSLRQ